MTKELVKAARSKLCLVGCEITVKGCACDVIAGLCDAIETQAADFEKLKAVTVASATYGSHCEAEVVRLKRVIEMAVKWYFH